VVLGIVMNPGPGPPVITTACWVYDRNPFGWFGYPAVFDGRPPGDLAAWAGGYCGWAPLATAPAGFCFSVKPCLIPAFVSVAHDRFLSSTNVSRPLDG